MRHLTISVCFALVAAAPSAAVEFLGVELCEGSVDTSVVLPVGSPLSLESAEIGRYGGLLLLFKAENGDIMDHIDNLMVFYTDTRGTGDAKKLQWSGNQITGYAQLIKKGYAALAVSTKENCLPADDRTEAQSGGGADPQKPVTESRTAPEPPDELTPASEAPAVDEAALEVAAATAAVEETGGSVEGIDAFTAVEIESADSDVEPLAPPEPEPEPPEDFQLEGKLKHSAAEDGWVDVMGVVVNNSGDSFVVASFDLSLYDGAGDLICVDTVSVNQLREGQERAFRSAIRCAEYDPSAVASWKLQFAGSH